MATKMLNFKDKISIFSECKENIPTGLPYEKKKIGHSDQINLN